jgi:aspartyl-tRNA(Asn)/glutamyl-tRNA(Gln) amidotransferase subunit A
MHDTIFFSACDLINLYKSKKLSPVENLKNTFDVIKKLNPKLNAFISIAEKRAMKQAKFSELNYLNNIERKLEGIPFGVKDVIDVQQEKTMNGSKLFEISEVKKNNSTVVNKLIDEGAIYIGKLHTHELAIGAPTFSGVDKPASNPWDFNKTAGGSSSGSGSAVGGYLVPFALGTDSGGSIRNPSSMCGIVGLKPTYNSIEIRGVQPLAKTIDTVGPMARTGKDISLIFSVLKKTLNTVNHNFKNLKIGIIEHFYNKDFIANEEVVVSFEKTIKVFEQNGSVVSKVNLDNLKTYHEVNGTIMAKEGYKQFNKELELREDLIDKLTFERLYKGKYISDESYKNAKNKKKELTQNIHEVLENFDILITPTNFDLPFNIGDISQINKYYMRHARSPFNVSGNPAISVPCGLSKTNLPIGFQIVGRYNADQFISDIAHDFLIKTDWENIREQNIIKNLFL